ncbi:MAG: low molecular weight protein-tyrosine-phosphatase [Bacteroidia bacterium]|nr:low molecular weight phosphotyrosine protein phosphatase [Bacteroidia bacterium]MDW8332666.1 low molecular weight protein-tyrosine-phosphatase [Bacteroidia bacterium]
MEKIRVLFICLGNICRSPMAKAIFVHRLKEAGLDQNVEVDSAGLGGWHEGEKADERTLKVLARHGVALEHRARQIRPRDLFDFHYLVVMDNANYERVEQMMRSRRTDAQLLKMAQFDPNGKTDVPDPYHGDDKQFEAVYEQLDRACAGLLNFLKQRHGWE